MKKELIIGTIIGAIAGSAITYLTAKKAIRKEVENEVLDDLDQIENDFNAQVKEFADLHEYALVNNESYKETVIEFYEWLDKSKHADIDATIDDVEKVVLKESGHSNVVQYNEYYQGRSQAVIEDDDALSEAEEEAENFNAFCERMAAEKPLHYVTRQEFISSPAIEIFDKTYYTYFVKDGVILDDAWNIISLDDVFDEFGSQWRNILARDGSVWVIDYKTGYMMAMTCNHEDTSEEILARVEANDFEYDGNFEYGEQEE